MAYLPRPPIVAVMGHIDHGKSSLLDYIRKSNVVAQEAGGITQKVSAYVATHTYEGKERQITFLDTPGHEAFKALRARGARAADVAILVIASEEGVKPQTVEAYKAAIEAAIPVVVAFTKIDKPQADIERAKVSALEHEIYLEGLGGSIAYTGVSAKTGEGVPELLDLVLLTADLADIQGDTDATPSGFVLESSQDPKQGISATLIIKDGTVRTGTFLVVDHTYAPVRFIENFSGERIAEAGPSLPIRISGFTSLPNAGSIFTVVPDKKTAEKTLSQAKKETMLDAPTTAATLPVVLIADVSGSLEALMHELAKISHEDISLRIINKNVGSVTEGDVNAAHAGGAIIIAFSVSTEAGARDLAERLSVPIETFSIIYDVHKRIEELLIARAPKIEKEVIVGEAKVLKIFSEHGNKHVIGASLSHGRIGVGQRVHIVRREIALGDGKVTNLQQAKIDAKEITTEGNFGAQIESKETIGEGDTLLVFTVSST